MAKKILNKKIAIIGSILLAILIIAAIVIFLRLGQDPQDFIRDAQVALSQTEKDYDAAEKAYKRAYKYAKNKELRIDILFKLAEIYKETNNWPGVAGCWSKIVTIDTSNVSAREKLLDYSYQLADSGNWGAWRNVKSSATELIDRKLDTSAKVYMFKGRAIMELTRQGQSTDPEKAVQEATGYFEKVLQAEPNNVDVYMYLAQAAGIKGQAYANQGVPNAMEQANKEAEDILKRGIENAPDQPKAYINYLMVKYQKAASDEQMYRDYEAKLIELTKKFPDSAIVYSALAQLYQKDIKDIDRAIVEIEKACELENENVNYALFAASLYYRRYSVYNDSADIYKAVDIAEKALTFPKSQDVPGPRSRENYINRFSLHSFLANCYLEQAMIADETQKSKWVELSEKEVHQITQLLGSGENPYTIMWKGRLALAKGDRDSAVRQMYTAYDKLVLAQKSASGSTGAIDRQLGQLAYTLAKMYMRTNETGAVSKFLATAINNGIYYSKPDVLLDYVDISLALQRWSTAVNTVDFFERYYSPTDRSKQARLRANIGARLLDQAQEELAAMDADDPNVMVLSLELNQTKIVQTLQEMARLEGQGKKTGTEDNSSYGALKTELQQLRAEQGQLLDRLFKTSPDSVSGSMILSLSRYYMSEARTKEAAKLVDRYLRYHPDSVSVKIYKKMMAEPDVSNIPQERVYQITESVLNDIADVSKRNMALAQNYHARGQLDKAAELYEKILKAEPDNKTVINSLFDIALVQGDAKQIRRLADIAKKENVDSCNGDYFAARAAMKQEDYKKAIEKLDSCLEKQPIFSGAYMLRSAVNLALGKETDAIADIEKAFELNPLNGVIAKNMASILYQRDKKLGSNASPSQTVQTREALIRAIALNQRDLQLQSFYAEYISETDPVKALAIRQQLQTVMPSLENAVLLGNMAYKIAQNQSDQAYKQTLLSIAEDAYKEALKIDPNSELALNVYSEFLRTLGRGDDAKKLLSQDKKVLWKYYLRDGQLDKAKEILDKLYQAQPGDANIVFGMLSVARKNADKEAIVEYSEKLLKLQNTEENQLVQIETFLETGMIAEAEKKLKVFRKNNPDNFSSLFLDAWLTAKKGQFEKALELTNQALEAQPNMANLWRLRGQINSGLSNFKEAINDFQKSKSLRDIAEVRVDLARVYLKSNRTDDAITELKRAIEKEQAPLGARGLLEQVYIKSNNLGKLRAFYNENMEKFP
ncbi:MAG: tetratricopeptide repeat protein, partial [Planctomycetes bacterium]|nr:tetratricopeptide repeat protein [Planctomycetota bacterium]